MGWNKKNVILAAGLVLSLALCSGCGSSGTKADQEENIREGNTEQAAGEEIRTAKEYSPGVSVEEDSESPTGYTATFVFEKKSDQIKGVKMRGQFLYVDPEMEEVTPNDMCRADDYENGMYPTSNFQGVYNKEMEYDAEAGVYMVSCPITSGSFPYSYDVSYSDGKSELIDDPANPSPAKINPKSNSQSTDFNHSVVLGKYDEEKQSESINMDYILPAEENQGTVTYVEYTGSLSDDQDLGIYLPAGYDPERTEPYKVLYASHGTGGNETDWFGMGHLNDILDNLGEDIIAVTMDNTVYDWDFKEIETNVLNYIIPYMEENYHVSAEAEDRAFCGLSRGSMTTFHMAFDYPEEFGYFGAFSGTDMSVVSDSLKQSGHKLYITCGTCDMASVKINNKDDAGWKYESFLEWLQENPADQIIDGGYVKGAHDWYVWSQSIKMFVEDICWS